MKKFNVLVMALIAIMMIGCEKNSNDIVPNNPNVPAGTGAIQSPQVTNDYSNQEISDMVVQFENGHFRDIHASQVPEVITTAFIRDFQNVRDVEWEVGVSNPDVYEVEFEAAGRDYTAFYDLQGNLLMYIVELWWNEVPQAVKNAVSAKYAGYYIDDVDRVSVGNTVIYQVDLEKGNSEIFAHFTENGDFISEGIDY